MARPWEISEQTLLQRINRQLREHGHQLARANRRGASFVLRERATGHVVKRIIPRDIEAYGRSLGVLYDGERLLGVEQPERRRR